MGKIPSPSQNHRNLITPISSLNLRICLKLALNTPKWVMVFMFKNRLEILMAGQESRVPSKDSERGKKRLVIVN
jgi:hypothetical protein